ncbi:hypothetical protein [Devosia sp. 66-14]|jgi:hypothetical protein|uniref:hypothetical protein n=1 Tax=Devosia sp. 66-14 TaxID=1895752 RepID=UPI00096359C1|nr:hypothetical protein [Devosia sp. 66-14]MBN9365150.1 hypothetical protein [Devosia sp.]OJX21350.1 MAG: hypothetical protein BGO83_20345 [Devosia sp. 66-14]
MTSVAATATIAVGATPAVAAVTICTTTAGVWALAAGAPDRNENGRHHHDDDGDAKHHVFHGHPRHSPTPAAYELKDMRA